MAAELEELLAPARTGARYFRHGLEELGAVTQLGSRALRLAVRGRILVPELVEQIDSIGLASLSVATLTAIFSSMVMSVQFAVQMGRFGAKDWVGNVVALSLVRELGPVLTALMVGGRVGAGIAAELGSMNVTEQVDALRSMGADPVEVLVVPRVLAAIIVLPLLTAFADALGIIGSMLITWLTSDINMTYFFSAMVRAVGINDYAGGLVKTLFFGLLIGLIACYQGLSTTGGTEGVGKATTRTVVIASISVLISDFILTNILLSFGL
jgi:phospholipid/cholesterol/gamma-HCH transport system permease protein